MPPRQKPDLLTYLFNYSNYFIKILCNTHMMRTKKKKVRR